MNVVNIRKAELNKAGYVDFQDWSNNSNHIYIGRCMNHYVKGTYASKWANPFSVKKYGRDGCLKMYEEYIKKSNLYNQLNELKGKTLGCWCKPFECHGDVLCKLLSEQ